MTFNPLADVVAAITERTAPGMNPPHTTYRPITAAECYDLARRSWMPAAAADALVRAARTIEEASAGRDAFVCLADAMWNSLEQGLEAPGPMEPEWSIHDRELSDAYIAARKVFP